MTSEEYNLTQARAVYRTLCAELDELDWHYDKYYNDLTIKCGVQGEDLPFYLKITIDVPHKIIFLLSEMEFDVPERRRNAIAVAVSQANNGMIDGNFDYDYLKGKISFRMTADYRDCRIGKELFNYMIWCASSTIDRYINKFLTITKNEMTEEEILKFVQ